MIHELRHYVPLPGKNQAMIDRFKVHVIPVFKKLNVKMLDFWVTEDESDGFWYVLEWPDAETGKETLAGIADSPDWQKVKALTEKDGPLIHKIESRFCRRPNWVAPAYRTTP